MDHYFKLFLGCEFLMPFQHLQCYVHARN
jgi:hypothetical protein